MGSIKEDIQVMKILFVIKGNESYLSQQAQIELVVGLHKQEIDIYLIGNLSIEVVRYLTKLKIKHQKIFPTKRIDHVYRNQFKELIEKYQIELVHFVDGKSARSGLMTLKKTSVKSVIYFGSGSLHWYDPSSYLTYLNSTLDGIICNSQFVFDHVTKQLLKRNKHKPVKIYKGYAPKWFEKIPKKELIELGIPKDAIVVCLVGNHRKIKGTKYFLRSSNHLETSKNVHYILIGKKTDISYFKKIKKESPIANKIHLLGHRTDVIPILKSIDIYVQTSLEEGFGRAISEAMSVGKPVVMTDAGGCTELIDESCGIITPIKNPEAIGKAISILINDDALRTQMGFNAKKRIENVYHIDQTINDTIQLYRRLLDK